MMRSVIISTAVLAALMFATACFAQTGPTGPTTTGAVPPPPPIVKSNGNQMLPDRLAETLRKWGHQVEIRKHSNNAISVISTFQQDGWRYQVEFEYATDQRSFFAVCHLGVPSSRLTSNQMMNLLKKCYDLHPTNFAVHANTGMLLLQTPIFSTINMSETNVQNILGTLVKNARDTHPLWYVGS